MTPTARLRIRRATRADLATLIALEQRSFVLDRQSSRSLAHLLTHAQAVTLLIKHATGQAALILLFRRRSGVARVYSIAVDPALRGRGVGSALLRAAEAEARQRGCDRMRSEVRIDNRASLAMFGAAGYIEFARSPGYYADGKTALRLQKQLRRLPSGWSVRSRRA